MPPVPRLRSRVNSKHRYVLLTLASFLLACVSASASDNLNSGYGIYPATSRERQPDWHRFVCSSQKCKLRAVDYRMQKDEHTVAFLSGRFGSTNAAVPTWYSVYTPRDPRDFAYGSMGATLKPGTDRGYRLVPRWNHKTREQSLTIYLETRQQRQRLGQIGLETLEQGLKPSDIVLWAGDLDGDGRLDLITRVRNTSTRGLHLWLSTLARNGEMVGVAASLDSWIEPEDM